MNLLFYRTIIVIGNNYRALPHARQIKVFSMQMILGSDPANINVRWILSRKDSHSVEVFVHQFQAFCIEYLISNRLDAASTQSRHRHCFWCVAFWDLRWHYFQVRLWKEFVTYFVALERRWQ